MADQIAHIRRLFQLYVENTASEEELAELFSFLNNPSNEAVSEQLFFDMIYPVKDSANGNKQQADLAFAWENMGRVARSLRIPWQKHPLFPQNIIPIEESSEHLSETPLTTSAAHRVRFLPKWGWAAAVAVVLGAAVYFWNTSKRTDPVVADNSRPSPAADIAPGGQKAVLTLADGSEILLDSAANGRLASQGGVQVIKQASGQIVYDGHGLNVGQALWNTMTTPRGGQYRVILPDGSRVWLNAASSIKYPTAFTGRERLVEVKGEVFFEIEKDQFKPFRVKINEHTTVDVLGTSFNVNAYTQEDAIRTTLVAGAVRVNVNAEKLVLKPGQQAQVLKEDGLKIAGNINVGQVVAWKNGYFDFNDEDLPVVMRQLERWYDIEVVYSGAVPQVTFKGKMDRNVQLSDVVRFLKNFGIKASLEGRKLTIIEA